MKRHNRKFLSLYHVLIMAIAFAILTVLLVYAVPASAQIQITDLGTLGGTDSVATAINDAGQVVGYSITSSGETHPFI